MGRKQPLKGYEIHWPFRVASGQMTLSRFRVQQEFC